MLQIQSYDNCLTERFREQPREIFDHGVECQSRKLRFAFSSQDQELVDQAGTSPDGLFYNADAFGNLGRIFSFICIAAA